MKTLITTLALLIAGNLWAQDAQIEMQFACTLNKSEIMDIIITRDEGTSDYVVQIGRRMWNEEPRFDLILRNNKVVRYGSTVIALSDLGRSGYALVRMTSSDAGDSKNYAADLDINIFDAERDLNTNGTRHINLCTRSI